MCNFDPVLNIMQYFERIIRVNVSVHNLRKLSTILLLLLTMKITNSDKCCEHGYMFKLKSFVLYFYLHCLIKVVVIFYCYAPVFTYCIYTSFSCMLMIAFLYL